MQVGFNCLPCGGWALGSCLPNYRSFFPVKYREDFIAGIEPPITSFENRYLSTITGSLGSSKTSTVPHCQCWLFKNLHLGVSLHLVIICINHILSILGSCPLTTLSGFINLKCSAKVAFRAFYQHSSSMVHMIFCDLASGESFGHDWLKSSQLCIAIFWFFFINELYFIAFSHDG